MTARKFLRWVIATDAKGLKAPGEPWTRSQIRTVIRAATEEVSGAKDFSDDEGFVRDIGID